MLKSARKSPGSWVKSLFGNKAESKRNTRRRKLRTAGHVETLEAKTLLAADFAMVRDIDMGAQSSNPNWITQVGDLTFFVAETEATGIELWVSDGTPEGTTLVKDIAEGSNASGPNSSRPEKLFAHNGLLYFRLTNKFGLWVSDGTEAGTQEISSEPAPGEFVDFGGELYFGNTYGGELWKTDGTADGTTMVADVNPTSSYSPLYFLTAHTDGVYFGADDGTHGRELWKSDGTSAGTSLVLDVEPGSGTGLKSELTSAGGKLYFRGFQTATGDEPWVSDGTAAGTTMLADVVPGTANSSPANFTAVGDHVVFHLSESQTLPGGSELWVTNGTALGTHMLKDIIPGSQGSYPGQLTEYDGRLIFPAAGGLWATDGTEAGTVEVLVDGPHLDLLEAVSFGSNLWLKVRSPTDRLLGELWKTDLTKEGTVQILGEVSDLRDLTAGDDELLFTSTTLSGGKELWRTDGSVSGTAVLKDLTPGTRSSSPEWLTVIGDELIFAATESKSPPTYAGLGRELWITSGTEASTVLLSEIGSGNDDGAPTGFMTVGDKTVFSANQNGSRMFVMDNATRAISNLAPYPFQIGPGNADNQEPVRLGDAVIAPAYSSATGYEIGITDGTPGGTFVLKDIKGGFVTSRPKHLTRVGNEVFFFADDFAHGTELWKTDGTTAGTVLVKDITPGSFSTTSLPNMAEVNGKLVFSDADGGTAGEELWVSDGTESGTVLLNDIWTGTSNSSRPHSFVSNGTTAFFFASDGGPGLGLFKTDATAGGTVLVRRFAPTSVAPDLVAGQAIYAGGLLYFVVDDGQNGSELWVSDGTEPGTTLVRDINPGDASAEIGNLTEVDGVVFFAARDGESGRELWRTDGTAEGTFLAADVDPGAADSDPEQLTDFNGILYFTADTIDYGRELFRLNAVPIVDSALYSMNKDGSLNFTLTGNDADSAEITFAITVNPEHGQLTGTLPNLVYTPAGGFSGSDEFYFQASDGVTTSLPGRVQINVRGTNPIVTFDVDAATHSEAAGRVEIPFSLDRPAPFDLEIPLTVSGTAVEVADFAPVESLFVAAGSVSGSLVVDLISDQSYEPGVPETIVLAMLAGSDHDLGTTTEVTVQIVDDDPLPTVSFDRGSQVIDEVAQTASVRLVLSAPAAVPVQVPFTISGTASSGSDYVLPESTTVTIPAGERVATIDLPILDDADVESLESVVFDLGIPTNATRGTGSGNFRKSTVYIRANDIPVVNVSTVYNTIIEDEGSIVISAKLTSAAVAEFTVPFTVGGYGRIPIEDVDFSVSSHQFVFAPGSDEATVTFTVLDDSLIENTEYAVLTLNRSATNDYVLGSRRISFVDITDNDATLSISASEDGVWEDHADQIDVTVELSNSLEVDTVVNVQIDSTVPGAGRFQLDGSAALVRTVVIPAFQTKVVMKLRVFDNMSEDPNGQIRIATWKQGAATGSQRSVVVEIKDNDPTLSLQTYVPGTQSTDDTPAFGLGSFGSRGSRQQQSSANGSRRASSFRPPDRSVENVTVNESDPGLYFQFRLSKPTNNAVTFRMDASGSATFEPGNNEWPDINDRFGQLNSTVTIPAGSDVWTVQVGLNSDTVFEPTETLNVSVHNAQNANIPQRNPRTGQRVADSGGRLTTKIKIIDDDTKPTISVFTDKHQLYELGDSSSVFVVDGSALSGGEYFIVEVSLSKTTTKDVEVELTDVDGHARNGSDFRIVGLNSNNKVTIPAGHASTRLRVEVIDDRIYEGDEPLTLRLTNNSSIAGINSDQDTITVNLIDNEKPPLPPVPEPPPTVERADDNITSHIGDAINGQLQISNAQGAYGEASEADLDRLQAAIDGDSIGVNPYPGPLQFGNAATGLLDNATVFLDSNFNGVLDFVDGNDNGIQDEGEFSELFTTTERDGSFALYFDSAYDMDGDLLFGTGDGRFVLTDGTDITINSTRSVKLTAPIGVYSITPLTTLVESLVRRHIPSVDDALSRVAQAVGIADYDIRFGNALYEILANDQLAGEAYKQSVLVHNTVLQIAATYAGAEANLDNDVVASLIYDELADSIANQGSFLNLSQREVLSSLIGTIGVQTGTELSTTTLDGLTEIMVASAARIDALSMVDFALPVTFAESVLRIKKVVREQAVDRLYHAAAGLEDITLTVDDFTGSNLDSRIATALIDVVVPSTIIVTNAEIVEGDIGNGNLMFEVMLIGDHSQPVAVDYATVDDLATVEDGDYAHTSGTLNWPAGDNSTLTVTVPVNGDSTFEADERLSLLLSNSTNGVIRVAQGYGFIVNDDSLSSALSPLGSNGTRQVNVSAGDLTGDGYANNQQIYRGIFTQPLNANLMGEDDVQDLFRVELLGTLPRADEYQFTGGGGAESDRLEWLAEGLTSVSLRISSADSGIATLVTDAQVDPVELMWSQVEALASFSTTVETFEIHIDGSMSPELILEDADPREFGRLRLRSASGSFAPIEFSNPLTTLRIVAANAATTFTIVSPDEKFTGAVDFSVDAGNEAPTDLTASASSVNENSPSGTSVGTFSTTDSDTGDTFTYSLVSGTGDTGNAAFTIVDNELRTAASLDFESKSSYSVRVQTTDSGGLTFEKTFTISVSDVNEAPRALAIDAASLPENKASGTLVGSFSTTDVDAGNSFIYSLVAGSGDADNSLFTIVDDKLQTAASLDFENQSGYSIRVQTMDSGGLTFEKSFVISVTDEDETSPTATIQSLPLTWLSNTITLNVDLLDPNGPAGEPLSGVAAYDVYVAIDSGNWTLFADDVPATQTQVTYTPESDHRYWFRAIATDVAGNVEVDSEIAETNTHTLDLDAPVTQVTSATTDQATGVISLLFDGTDAGGSNMAQFEVYVSVDGGDAEQIVGSPVNAGAAGNGVFSGAASYQGLRDGAEHTYRFYTRGVDNRGNQEAAPANGDDVTVVETFAAQAGYDPTGIDVQLGQTQRSYVRYTDIVFSNSAALIDLFNNSQIEVERFGIGAANATQGSGTLLSGFGATANNNSLRLDFGANGIGGRGSAGDGFYRISLDLDGDGDADDAHFEFFRLWGDANGDGRVDRDDTLNLFEDINGDGRVDSRDRRDIRRRLGQSLNNLLLPLLDD